VVAADRSSDKGASYIDFEFLQKPLTLTGTAGGGFSSGGLDGGRTAKDFVGGSLEYAALDIGAGVDPGDESDRRQHQPSGQRALRRALGRIENLDPRGIHGGIGAVELPAEIADLCHRAIERRIERIPKTNRSEIFSSRDRVSSHGASSILFRCCLCVLSGSFPIVGIPGWQRRM
jgi:hypothetical protein